MARPQKAKRELPAADGKSGPLGIIETHLGYVLHRTDLLHMSLLSSILGEIGLTPARATALGFIHNNPGCDQSTLARALGINRASAMEVVNTLEAFGTVERKPGQSRRSHSLHLTAKGNRLHTRSIEAARESEKILAAELTDEEREQLDEMLRRIRASLEAYLSNREIKKN